MHSLVQQLKSKWSAYLLDHFSLQVGLSGGVDSVVLLHILTQLRDSLGFKLSAIHINHGISANAEYWTNYCQDLCDTLGVELTIVRHQIKRVGGESLENNARKIRYQEFAKSDENLIALAHHQNDQIETTLSQVFRGSDLHNIAGMQELSSKYGKQFWRPLLNTPRSMIEDYACEFNLVHIEDESNSDTNYLRNFIRHDVLPRLLQFDPNIGGKILKLPIQTNELLALVDEVAQDDLSGCLQQKLETNLVELEKFKLLSSRRQQNMLAYYIKQQNLPLPSQRQLTEFIRQALSCEWDRSPQLKLGSKHLIIKKRGDIFIRGI